MGNLSREKPLHLFNTTENGIISPFHDIISDAIIRLVQNPDKLLSELSSKNQYLYDQIQKVIDIDLSLPLSGKASKEFLSRYEENLNNSLVYYANTLCVREIANTEKINDETMYMLLSVFIEYLSHKKSEQYNSETIQRIISLLANN